MTDNMKKFLEEVCKDKECIEKLKQAETAEAVLALAEEKGIILTEEDLKAPEASDGPVDDDELDGVAGGMTCVCVVGGGGEASDRNQLCVCVVGGSGVAWDFDQENQEYIYPSRCACAAAGGGKDF